MIPTKPAADELPVEHWFAPDGFALRLVRRKARRLARCAGFTAADREDIEQELLLKLWEARDRFDPQLSHPHAFITTVVERAAASILRAQKAHKRGNQVAHTSLDEVACCHQDDPGGAVLAPCTPSHQAAVDLACDVSELLSRLPSQLREVAELLASHSKRRIAKRLGISRRTLDRRIDALRSHFAAAGLDEIS